MKQNEENRRKNMEQHLNILRLKLTTILLQEIEMISYLQKIIILTFLSTSISTLLLNLNFETKINLRALTQLKHLIFHSRRLLVLTILNYFICEP